MKFRSFIFPATIPSLCSVRSLALSAVTLWILVMGGANTARAQAPINDFCSGAIVIAPNGPFPHRTLLVPDISAATTTGDPVPETNCVIGATNSVWYVFTPGIGGLYTFSTSFGTLTTVPDTAMTLYSSANGCAGPLTTIECNDDQSNDRSAVSATLTAGQTYYLVVWAGKSIVVGDGTALEVLVTRPPTPVNDLCGGAELIPPSGPFPYLTALTDITRAGTASDPPSPLCQTNVGNSIWYKFTPGVSGTYVISGSTNTTVYDTVMAIYTAATCAGPFTAVGCADIVDKPAAITNTLTAGVNYFIVVWDSTTNGASPGETLVQLSVLRQVPPTVVTLPASSITTNAAVLNGTATPNGLSTRTWFQFGVSTNYGVVTMSTTSGSGSAPAPFAANLVGLTNGVVYHYRAVATNLLGMVVGQDQSFVWVNTRPVFTTPVLPPNSSFLVRFSGVPGQVHSVWASSDLTSWTKLGTAVDLGGGQFSYDDAGITGIVWRFYRIASP